MQQATYNSITSNGSTIQANKAAKDKPADRRASLAQRIARRWDLVGVLALMGSSAAYGAFALAHVGL